MSDRKEERKPFKKRSLSQRAGLNFPVARIFRYLKAGPFTPRISIGAAVYFTAVLEYLTSEILELAANITRSSKRMRITPRHIFLGVRHDHELDALFRDVTISEGGVLPKIHSVLLPKRPAKPPMKP